MFFNRVIGVAGFGRFKPRDIDLENTMVISGSDADTVEIKPGGFQLGGGLRLKF